MVRLLLLGTRLLCLRFTNAWQVAVECFDLSDKRDYELISQRYFHHITQIDVESLYELSLNALQIATEGLQDQERNSLVDAAQTAEVEVAHVKPVLVAHCQHVQVQQRKTDQLSSELFFPEDK